MEHEITQIYVVRFLQTLGSILWEDMNVCMFTENLFNFQNNFKSESENIFRKHLKQMFLESLSTDENISLKSKNTCSFMGLETLLKTLSDKLSAVFIIQFKGVQCCTKTFSPIANLKGKPYTLSANALVNVELSKCELPENKLYSSGSDSEADLIEPPVKRKRKKFH